MAKILLLEDEAHIREAVMDWLVFEGYEVTCADNGRLGLALLPDVHPDLILCDIAMPELDGHGVLIEVRSNAAWSHIPFIFLTAVADRDSMRLGMDMGADDYITKPFTHAEVLNAVQSRLKKKAFAEAEVDRQLAFLNNTIIEERERHLFKSRLVAMFSHDFRNPLAAILTSANIIRNYEARLSGEKKREHFDRIEGAVRLLLQMLDDMLMVAEIEGGHLNYHPERLDVATLVGKIVDEFRLIDQGVHRLTFQHTLHELFDADPKLLRHIMTNLISNALKYSPAASEVAITLSEEWGHLRLDVQDHGFGIPQESLAHIFEPFHRASNIQHIKGTGLGLAMVKECVEHHQGQISVESYVGEGTLVTVIL